MEVYVDCPEPFWTTPYWAKSAIADAQRNGYIVEHSPETELKIVTPLSAIAKSF